MLTIAIDGDVFAAQRLHDKIGYHAPIIWMHPRTVCVEDTRNLYLHSMLSIIVKEQSLCAALTLIIAGARTNRVHISPILFTLRMHLGIAVDFRCRGLENFGTHALGQTEHIDCAMNRCLGGLNRVKLIVYWAGWTRQIENLIDFYKQRKRHIVAHHFKSRVAQKVGNICASPSEEIIHAQDIGSTV